MPARLYVDATLRQGTALQLPEGPARHVQVLRLQPGEQVILFNGRGGEWRAEVLRMGRREVEVLVQDWSAIERELSRSVTLAVGMPANERFDWLVEKAAELGAACVQPLMCERSVLRLASDRAHKKRDHWQGIAIAAAEQSGRTRVPEIATPLTLESWLAALPAVGAEVHARWVLSPGAAPLKGDFPPAPQPVLFLSGPEGGLSPRELDAALAGGFRPLGLGPRVLRAETAPIVALAVVGMHEPGPAP